MKNNQQAILQRSILKVRLYRIEKGLSQPEFSELIGISNRKYQRIEAGESVPDLELLYRISDVLKVNFDHLFSPNLQHSHIEGVTFFDKKEDFLQEKFVKETSFDNFFTKEFEKNIFYMEKTKDILSNSVYNKFRQPLTFGDHNSNCFNMVAMNEFDQKTEFCEFSTINHSFKSIILLWDMLCVDILKYGFFKYNFSQKHNRDMTAYCKGMMNHQGKVFILTLFDSDSR